MQLTKFKLLSQANINIFASNIFHYCVTD